MQDKPNLVFLDANIFFAATLSSDGGSALILRLSQHKIIKCITSKLILYEAERNIREKLGEKAISKYHKLLKDSNISIAPSISETDIMKYSSIIEEKDMHVLASATKCDAKIIITLDKKHFFTKSVLDAKLPFKIMVPKEFLVEILNKEKKINSIP